MPRTNHPVLHCAAHRPHFTVLCYTHTVLYCTVLRTLHFTALCCTNTALYCTVLHTPLTLLHCVAHTPHFTALCCAHTALYCTVLRTHHHVLHCDTHTALYCTVLHTVCATHTAHYYNVLRTHRTLLHCTAAHTLHIARVQPRPTAVLYSSGGCRGGVLTQSQSRGAMPLIMGVMIMRVMTHSQLTAMLARHHRLQ
jgi:hypothetical protein